jgi:hypothetical protein
LSSRLGPIRVFLSKKKAPSYQLKLKREKDFPCRRDRAMCVEDGGRREPPPEKEHTMKNAQKPATETLVQHNRAEAIAKQGAVPIDKPGAT